MDIQFPIVRLQNFIQIHAAFKTNLTNSIIEYAQRLSCSVGKRSFVLPTLTHGNNLCLTCLMMARNYA